MKRKSAKITLRLPLPHAKIGPVGGARRVSVAEKWVLPTFL